MWPDHSEPTPTPVPPGSHPSTDDDADPVASKGMIWIERPDCDEGAKKSVVVVTSAVGLQIILI